MMVDEDDGDMRALASAECLLLDALREERCRTAASALLNADYMLLGTGAGMSVGCGLRTYKSYAALSEGCFPGFDETLREIQTSVGSCLPYEQVASPETLQQNPAAFHSFMTGFYNSARDTEPCPGYRILRAWQDFLFPDRSFTFTSNVDGMHARAGFTDLYECHGSKVRYLPCHTFKASPGTPSGPLAHFHSLTCCTILVLCVHVTVRCPSFAITDAMAMLRAMP